MAPLTRVDRSLDWCGRNRRRLRWPEACTPRGNGPAPSGSFNTGDTADAPPVLLINQAAARFHWPGEDPVGKFAFVNGTQQQYKVVGVVADVPSRTLEEGGDLEFYRPMAQQGPVSTELVVRAKLALPALISSVREALGPLQPDLPASDFRPLDELIERAVSPRRLVTSLVTAFAVLALVLASLGDSPPRQYACARIRESGGATCRWRRKYRDQGPNREGKRDTRSPPYDLRACEPIGQAAARMEHGIDRLTDPDDDQSNRGSEPPSYSRLQSTR